MTIAIQAMVDDTVLVGALTRHALLHSVRDLKAV